MNPPPFHITVIGLGAMGGGMARALMESNVSQTVTGYDMDENLCTTFYQETVTASKAKPTSDGPTKSLSDSITSETQFVVLVLQNEQQCEAVCFGTSNDTESSLISLVPKKSVVILCSTVTPTWATRASKKFEEHDIYFIDSPISGGPVRARDGELTLLSSADEYSDPILKDTAKPVMEAMAREWYIIEGGAGKGSMVKMVHQLLAGVHVVVTAEALALAAKAGLDVEQVYTIVNGAAGASWMFKDRGQRMIESDGAVTEIKSQLQIFVKDLDIVYAEAKKLQSPVPLAATALQQFINAQGLGLSRYDDSSIKRVYEQISGVPIAGSSKSSNKATKIEGDNVNEYWKMEDGSYEQIVEVGSEPRHKVIVQNEYVRAIRVIFPPNDTTLAHRHAEDSLYFFLVENGLQVVNHVKGNAPACDCMDFGEVRYGAHKSEKPLVHKITNKTIVAMHCIDAELLQSPPIVSPVPLIAEYHECIKVRDRCRVYKLTLQPGQSVTTSYMFFHCTVILQGSTIEKSIISSDNHPSVTWKDVSKVGDFAWKEPTANIKKTNVGTTTYIEYIAEWR